MGLPIIGFIRYRVALTGHYDIGIVIVMLNLIQHLSEQVTLYDGILDQVQHDIGF